MLIVFGKQPEWPPCLLDGTSPRTNVRTLKVADISWVVFHLLQSLNRHWNYLSLGFFLCEKIVFVLFFKAKFSTQLLPAFGHP